ncbi:MAG: hypothetical protein U1F36_14510 [Planctomycetota bacterium]
MRAALIATAVAALVGASAVQGTPRVEPGTIARDVMRPFVLPGLWNRLTALPRNNDPTETLAVLRLVADLIPEWTDGLIDVAWREALDLGREAQGADARAKHVNRAVTMLLADLDARREADPHVAAELLLAAATILTVFGDQDRAGAAAYRELEGIDSISRAGELTERALDCDEDPTIALRSAHAAVRVVAAALRDRDVARAQLVLDAARTRFRTLADRESARRALHALDRLPPLRELANDPQRTKAFLGDPDLDEIARAILDGGRG